MTRLTALLLASLFACLIVIFAIRSNYNRLDRNYTSLQNIAGEETKKAKFWEDEAGKAHARVKVVETNLETAKQMLPGELESLRTEISGLKRNLKNLESYTKITTTSSGEITVVPRDTVFLRDSTWIKGKHFTYSDKWIGIRGSIVDSRLNLSYRYRDSLVFATYWRNEGLFRKRVLTLDAVSFNPNSQIDGITNVEITVPKRRRPRLGIYAGYGASRDGLGPQVGVGIVY